MFNLTMPTVADQLRQAREAKKLTVYQVAESTKIRTDHIRALDEGNFDAFPAPVYIRGFVRTYAGYLKLEVDKLITQLNAELAQTDKHHEDPPLTNKQRTVLDLVMFQLTTLNWRIILPALGAALILFSCFYAFRAWAGRKTRDPLAELGPGLYQPAQKSEGEILPVPPAPQRR